MSRRKSREKAFTLLYQIDFDYEEKDECIKIFFEENTDIEEKDKEFILKEVNGVLDNMQYINDKIEKYSKGWKLDRIPKIDLALIRLSIYEIYFNDDIPTNVSINEVIELAKIFSGEDSHTFINGLLGKIVNTKDE